MILKEYWTFLIFAFFIPTISGHVSLIFPPARFPNLDFLDNARTKGPCGIPKPPLGKGNPTTLRAGSTFNVTWTLTYPHQGGFRIELLDDKDQPKYALTPENVQFIGQEDQTAQRYQVTLPSNLECENCGIRLLRQGGEWGSEYQFWSCADVNIVKEPKDVCQGHGESKDGQCRCERLYSGEFCQFKDDCWADQDCGINGKCEELKTVSYPRRVCYCKQGWFGPNCASPSPLQKSNLDLSQYEVEEFGPDKNKMYWRLVKEQTEVEIILQYPTQSWIAIGWRPQNVPGSCGNLDRLVNGVSSNSIAQHPNPVAEPKPTAEPGPTLPNLPPYSTNETLPPVPSFPQSPKNATEVGNETNPWPGAVHPPAIIHSSVETTSGSPLETPPYSGRQTGTQLKGQLNGTAIESTDEPDEEGPLVTGIPGIGSGPDFTGTPVPFPPPYASANGSLNGRPATSQSSESDVTGELCYGDWRYPTDCNESCDHRISWTYVEETDEIEFSVEVKAPANSWTALGFSPSGTMNDADMIVIKSLQNRLTVLDMFTNGYAPPAKDPLQNVTVGPAAGSHVNGILRTSFRRPRRSSDSHDVSFTDTECYYFLLGSGGLNADGSMNKHTVKPKVSKRKVCIGSCNPSPLGVGGEQYVTCDQEFKFPPGCRPPACDYVANWTYIAQSQEVIFQISSREIGRWTGIGFSREGNMTNSDVVMGWVYENGTYLTDRFAYGRHQPAIDKQQDLKNIHGRIEDDIQTITFSRKLVTNDPEDISLKECLYYLFPVGGGRVLARTAKDFQDKTTPLGFHDQTLPKISRDLICICDDQGVPVNVTQTRLRRQADQEEEEETEEDQEPITTSAPVKRPPAIPPGQSAVNITLGAKPIPIIDSNERAATTHARTTTRKQAPTTTTEEPEEEETTIEEEEEEEATVVITTTESLLKLQSAIVAVNSSITVPPAAAPAPAPPGTPNRPTATADASPKSNQVPVPEPEPKSNSSSISVPESGPKTPLAEPHPEHAAPEPEPKAEPASNAELHPMDCVDMVIGSAIGQSSRVGDYYSISRSTPKLDDYFGGSQSLTAATGYEENGVTTIAFRRRLTSSDQFDHNITVGESLNFIWAKGQEYGNYSHNAPSGLEQGSASVKEFYSPDVLAYHGNKNRGSFTLSFGSKKSSGTSAALCRQEFVYPAGCKAEACHYNVTWLRKSNDVEFRIEARADVNHWTGIGFSKDGLMAKSDAVIITADTVGAPEVTDRFLNGYDAPVEDKKQNIFNIESSFINGRIKAKFLRPLATDDAEQDVDLSECVYFLYPYNGGPISENRVQKHSATPLRSTEQICFNKCQPPNSPFGNGPDRSPPVVKKPPEFSPPVPVVSNGRKFLVVMRLLSEQWNDALSNTASPEFEAMSIKMIKLMDTLLRQKFAGFEKARVLKFTQGSVIAEIEVSATGLNSVQIHEAIVPTANAGRVDGIQIDPEFVRVREIQIGLTPEEIRNYVIIAVACFLVMVATAFAVCMIIRTRRNRSREISGVYPVAYQYPVMGGLGPMDPKKGFYENPMPIGAPGYVADYNTATGSRHLGTHNRQFSSATTATPINGKTPSPGSDKRDSSGAARSTSAASSQNKNGNGETSYGDWFTRVNGNSQAQSGATPRAQQQQPPQGQGVSPYVQYPNDPYSYYTMGGSQRSAPFMQSAPPRSAPPPGYYRPY